MFIGNHDSLIDHLFASFKDEQPVYYDVLLIILRRRGMTQRLFREKYGIKTAKAYCIIRSEALTAFRSHLHRAWRVKHRRHIYMKH
jgi:hypothetical protein